MQTNQIFHIYGALQTLEQSLEVLKTTVVANRSIPQRLRVAVDEQEKVVRSMRRTANSIQLAIAHGDTESEFRLLQIFYGLHYMVRPEITAATRELSSVHSVADESTVVH